MKPCRCSVAEDVMLVGVSLFNKCEMNNYKEHYEDLPTEDQIKLLEIENKLIEIKIKKIKPTLNESNSKIKGISSVCVESMYRFSIEINKSTIGMLELVLEQENKSKLLNN